MLREIKKPNRDHVRRVLQCLVVAIRPLGVKELAEVLAVDFDDAEGIPKLKPNWRWEDQEQALLTSCSSLIAIVDTGSSRVVQFSHFSVKEYLTSERLATSSQDVSRYHVTLGPAHTILAQACMSILLQLHNHDEQDDVDKYSPLARYAAEYWARHAQYEDVVSRIKGMEYLFDVDKPYFAAWCQLHDIDTRPSNSSALYSITYKKSDSTSPLYYAALCGFSNLVEQLIVKHPEHVYALGGCFVTPAVAALAGRHFKLAEVLHRNGSSLDPIRAGMGWTPLKCAARYGDLEMVQVLLDYGVDANSRGDGGVTTPLFQASCGEDSRVVRLLLDHGADPNTRSHWGATRTTPLHAALEGGKIEIARILVEHGASAEAKNSEGRTPLDCASEERRDEIIKLLSEHRTK